MGSKTTKEWFLSNRCKISRRNHKIALAIFSKRDFFRRQHGYDSQAKVAQRFVIVSVINNQQLPKFALLVYMMRAHSALRSIFALRENVTSFRAPIKIALPRHTPCCSKMPRSVQLASEQRLSSICMLHVLRLLCV